MKKILFWLVCFSILGAKKPGHHSARTTTAFAALLCHKGTGKPPTRRLRPVPKHSPTAEIAAEERLKPNSHDADLLLK